MDSTYITLCWSGVYTFVCCVSCYNYAFKYNWSTSMRINKNEKECWDDHTKQDEEKADELTIVVNQLGKNMEKCNNWEFTFRIITLIYFITVLMLGGM